jgi:hypothetical protein
VVHIPWYWRHPKYGRILLKRTKLFAHDEFGLCSVGDMVRHAPEPICDEFVVGWGGAGVSCSNKCLAGLINPWTLCTCAQPSLAISCCSGEAAEESPPV